MPKYLTANRAGYVSLLYQREQMAFLRALAERQCVCGATWSITWGDPATLTCPRCALRGERVYDRFLLYAGRQGGKSRLGTLAGVLEASMPETYGWVTAPTYRDLTDFVEPAFFAQVPQDWLDRGDWNVSDRLLTLPNDARVAFRSLEDPEAMRGPTLDWYLMDEACKVSGRARQVGNATLAIKHGAEILTTTPKGEDWVYEDVWLRAEQGAPGCWAAKWHSKDNPVMDPVYVEAQRSQMSPEMFAQEYEADIVTFQGAIYGGLIEASVVDDTTEAGLARARVFIPEWPSLHPSRQAIIGLDPGSDHPFAGTLAVITDKGIVFCGEYEEREKPAAIHAGRLKAMARGLSPKWVCDRSQAQMILELAQHGIFAAATEGGPGSVLAGIERLKSWMLSGRLIYLKSAAPRLISRLKSYRWSDTEKRDGSKGAQEPYKKGDDLPDCARYTVLAWPHLPDALPTMDGRDLSQLSDADRWAIERFRKHDTPEDAPVVGLGDFYGGEVESFGADTDSMWG